MALVGTLPTLSWLEAFTTAHLTEAAARWSKTANSWDESFTRLASDMLRPGGTDWDGPAADAAQDSADKAQFAVRAVANHLRDAADTAEFGAEQLDGLHRKTLDAIDQARTDGFDVGEDLSVTDTRTSSTPHERSARQALADEHAESIHTHSGQLDTLDNEYGRKLLTATEGIDAVELPSHNDDKSPPAQMAAWGNKPLSPGDPSAIGNTGGVKNAEDVQRIVDPLPTGKKPHVKTLPTPAAIHGLYEQLTENSAPAPPSGYPGQGRVLDDGTRIGYRPHSKSGGGAIDIKYPDGATTKVHLPEPPKTPQPSAPSMPIQGNAGVPEAIAEAGVAPSSPASKFPDWGTHIPPGELAKSDDPVLGNLGKIIESYIPPDPDDPKNTA